MFGLMVVVLLFPVSIFAQIHVGGSQTIKNPIKADSFGELITDILNIIITIGVPIITLGVVYSGFLFVDARGNESKITQAKQTFMYTIIGAAIVLGALVIVEIIEGTVGQLRS